LYIDILTRIVGCVVVSHDKIDLYFANNEYITIQIINNKIWHNLINLKFDPVFVVGKGVTIHTTLRCMQEHFRWNGRKTIPRERDLKTVKIVVIMGLGTEYLLDIVQTAPVMITMGRAETGLLVRVKNLQNQPKIRPATIHTRVHSQRIYMASIYTT